MFEYPRVLFLLLGLPIFFSMEIFYTVQLKKIFYGKELRILQKKFLAKIFFYGIGYTGLLVVLAHPIFFAAENQVVQTNAELFFLLDVSNSMGVDDVGTSRLNAAKAMIKSTVHSTEIKRGLILFKGDSIISLPLTEDREIFDIMLSDITTDTLSSAGTNIESACKYALKNFSEDDSVKKIIMLLTDGDETIGELKKTSALLNAHSIACIVVGIGSSTGEKIKVYDDNENEKIITAKLDEKNLKEFVSRIDGKSFYFRYDSLNAADTIAKKITELSKSGQMISVYKKGNRSSLFLIVSFIFIFAGFILGEHQWKK